MNLRTDMAVPDDMHVAESSPLVSAPKVAEGKGSTTSGCTATLVLSVTSILLSPLLIGYALGYSSPTQCHIMADMWKQTDCKATSNQFSLFTSLPPVGAIIGGFAGAPLTEYIGRRKTAMACAVPFVFGFVLTGLMEHSDVLGYFGRTLQGVGAGMTSSAVPVYIAELAPVNLRGTIGALFQLSVTLGFLLVFSLYSLDWRTLSYVAAAPAVLMMVTLTIVPESPFYLVKTGHLEQAWSALVRLRQKGDNCAQEIEAISLKLEMSDTSYMTLGEKVHSLLKREVLVPLAIGVFLMTAQQFSGINAVLFYSQSILEDAGVGNPNLGTIYVGLVQVVFTIVCTFLIDRAGRRPLLMVSAAGMSVAAVSIGLTYYYADCKASPTISLVSMLVYIMSFSLGLGPGPWLICAELFPSHLRGVCMSICSVWNWTMAFVVSYTFASMRDGLGTDGVFWFFGAVTAVTVVGTFLFVPETKGKSQDEIARFFVPSQGRGAAGYSII